MRYTMDDSARAIGEPRDETWEVVNAALFPGYRVTIEAWWPFLWTSEDA